MDLTYDRLLRLAHMLEDYKSVDAYMRKPKRLNYVQFDYDAGHCFPLFMQEPDFDFPTLEERIDYILGALPAVKRIFAQPFIHLKEQNIIMPVEAARVVNNDTLTHIASHSEMWANVTDDGIKPEKLLTRIYEDNYGIYENLVFCNVVDEILTFARSNIRFLRELIYTNRTIEINLLDRVNHLNYFLALGKLHIGYSQNFGAYYAVAARCLNKLLFMENSITPRLKRPVYKLNRRRPSGLKLRKTNILSMHKEYHRIYKLARYMSSCELTPSVQLTEQDIAALGKNYFFFCHALCIFALGHFNFACDEKKTFYLGTSTPQFAFKGWTADVKVAVVGKTRLLSVEVNKDKPYTVVLIPSLASGNDELLRTVKTSVQADEYIICSPFDDREKTALFIDITSIESFRRLQQIFLRAMINSDDAHGDCPFCNGKMSSHEMRGAAVYACESCRTEIYEANCPVTDRLYYSTKITGYAPELADGRSWLAEREAESIMYYRNITEIDERGEPVCPHCGRVH